MIADQHLSVAEVARRLDVGENLLHTWAEAYRERGTDAFPGHGCPSPADDELRRLRAENVRLRAGRELLKKPPRTSPADRMTAGWAMASRRVGDALDRAVRRRLPEEGLVVHSDRGSQYASDHPSRRSSGRASPAA